MPVFMDRHHVEGATRHSVEAAHKLDLELQEKYGVEIKTYWFDEARHTAFCLLEAPDEETVRAMHGEAHGLIPNEIIEVDPALVESFLGRISDPVPVAKEDGAVDSRIDSAFRVIMFTDLKDSTAMTTRLGDDKAMHLLRIHNALTRTALRAHNGHEVKHTGDGFMVSFVSAADAVGCSIGIQQAFDDYNKEVPDEELLVRIGLSAGEPVAEDGDLFGAAVNLAARLCAHAAPAAIVAETNVRDACDSDQFAFVDEGEITPKGFSRPIRVYGIPW